MDSEQKTESNPSNMEMEMSDINLENGKEEDGMKKISNLTISSQNGEGKTNEPQLETNANGGGLLSKKKRPPIESFQITNEGIEHDICVTLKQEGDFEDEVEKEQEEEIQVSSPMMMDKPAEMRPYSVALEVMFRRKELKSKRKKICLIALTVLLAIFLIGGIIAVLIVFLGDTGGTEPDPVAIQGEFRISNRDYDVAYSNPKTTEYKQLQQEFITEMDNLYKNSTFKDIYINTKVSGFREGGGVVVAFVVQLERMGNENSVDSEGNNNVDDNDTNQSDEEENQTNAIYRQALGLIIISADDGRLGNFKGTVINLTLVPGEGRPVETVTIPMAAVTTPTRTTSKPSTTSISSTTTTEQRSSPTTKVLSTTVTTAITSPSSASTTMRAVNATSSPNVTNVDIVDTQTDGADISLPSSSYDYFSDSITPFPTIGPFPGDVFKCEPIAIQDCLDILPYNMTTSPNPHGLGNTMEDIMTQYGLLSMFINSQCHDDGSRVLCSLLHTKCTGETTNLFMAFLETYIPCRSLCLEVSDACLVAGGPINTDELCDALPESADETICYRSPLATGPLSCMSDYCLNSGSCFVIMNQTMCRCADGFIGERCEIEAVDPCVSNPCQNQGRCQTETPSLPGLPLFYICYCEEGHYGKHCEFIDDSMNQGMVDTMNPGLTECSGYLLIPECAELVPYNLSKSAAVLEDQYRMQDWPIILNRAEQCHPDGGVLVCATMQRKCTHEGPIPPCRALCERVSSTCNISTFGLPSDNCLSDVYSDSLHPLDCFDVTYTG